LLAFFIASPRNNDVRTFVREGQCSGSPDTCECASNQNNGGIHEISP
jgi:uncharacterized protein (DUF1499 family)